MRYLLHAKHVKLRTTLFQGFTILTPNAFDCPFRTEWVRGRPKPRVENC